MTIEGMEAHGSDTPGDERNPGHEPLAKPSAGKKKRRFPQEQMREWSGPQAVDQAIRGAIATCWMMLPADQKSAAVVEAQIRRLVDRALRDFREDCQAFGFGSPG
jgi:hypothetical protein